MYIKKKSPCLISNLFFFNEIIFYGSLYEMYTSNRIGQQNKWASELAQRV